jgi:hypothetical protein
MPSFQMGIQIRTPRRQFHRLDSECLQFAKMTDNPESAFEKSGLTTHETSREHVRRKTVQNELSAFRQMMNKLGAQGTDDCHWVCTPQAWSKRLDACGFATRSFRYAAGKVRDTACALSARAPVAHSLFDSYVHAHIRHVARGGTLKRLGKCVFSGSGCAEREGSCAQAAFALS